jgi:hypothetical protein
VDKISLPFWWALFISTYLDCGKMSITLRRGNFISLEIFIYNRRNKYIDEVSNSNENKSSREVFV